MSFSNFSSHELAVQTHLPPSSLNIDAQSVASHSQSHRSVVEADDEAQSSPSITTSAVSIGTYGIALREISRTASNGQREHDSGINVSSLAPVDGGIQAWSFLAGAFLIQTLIWGIPNSFGVFLNSYLQDEALLSQPHAQTILPLIGTLSSGIMYCSGVVLYPILARYPKSRKWMMWTGVILSWLSLFAASFATKVSQLLLFQGIVFGIGGSFLYAPSTSFMMEWFVRRRGLASGIINAGTSVGGLALPPVLPKLIEKLGRAQTLRYLSLGFTLTLVVQPAMKPRLPAGSSTGIISTRRDTQAREDGEETVHNPQRHRWSWALNVPFQLSVIASTVQGLAYFVPVLYLPTFASSLGINASDASLSVALLNGASFLSRIVLGVLADRLSPFTLAMLCAFGTSLVTFLLWGVVAIQATSHFSGLLAFGISYGALTGGWTSLMVGFIRPVSKDDPRLATNLMGLLYAVRGVGNVLSTPISSSLFHSTPDAYSSRFRLLEALRAGGYEKMIIFVGSCFAGAGVLAGMGSLAEKSQYRRARARD